MEKGPSEYAKYWTSDYNELYHFFMLMRMSLVMFL